MCVERDLLVRCVCAGVCACTGYVFVWMHVCEGCVCVCRGHVRAWANMCVPGYVCVRVEVLVRVFLRGQVDVFVRVYLHRMPYLCRSFSAEEPYN